MQPFRISAATLAAALAIAMPASAQQQTAPGQALAGVIRNALAPSSHGDWRYSWSAVSSRISSLMHWHLPGPDLSGEETITRRGWISVSGSQVSVTAWGEDETVGALSFEINSWPRIGDDQPFPVIEALAAQGVAAVEIARNAPLEFHHTDQPVIVYRLTAEGRDSGNLTQTVTCTSPQSAAAQRCTVSYTLEFGD